MSNQLVDQTNLYSVQKTGFSIQTNKEKIEQLIGIQMRIGTVRMPRYQSFWAANFANSLIDTPENKGNRLYKVQPILEALRANCQNIEQEEYQSIDEQIVPAKTKYSGIRQYNPKKPHK